ncbi:MAG: sulfite exporter TauE/SafE family protein [Acidimicrobiales bacterium]|nr:sulfite exporter TauE/SafE family protein [Acidimicrobiales bacterium]
MTAAIILGLVIGLALGSLGGGGSILAVPVLAHLAGQSAPAATATALVAVGVSAAVGSVGHARKGHVRWGAAAAFVATGVVGSWVGTRLNGTIDGDVLLLAFSGLVVVAAHRMLFACPTCTNVGEDRALAAEELISIHQGADGRLAATAPVGRSDRAVTDPPATVWRLETNGSQLPGWADPAVIERNHDADRRLAKVVVAGSVVGLLTGLFGVGGGFVIVPALTLALGLNMPKAIGTSLVIIVGNALVALGFRGLGAVDWGVAVGFTSTMLVGSLAGSTLAPRLPVDKTLKAFAGLLLAVAVANGIAAGWAIWG